jgi:predicted site-specific integrase-resolvase
MSIPSCGCGRAHLRPELYSPKETEHILSVSHATLYRLINAGKLDARKLNGKTVITAESIGRLIADLPKVRQS